MAFGHRFHYEEEKKEREKSAENGIFGGRRHIRRKTTFPAEDDFSAFFWQILDHLLSPTNFGLKHHGAISSPYAQIRAGEFRDGGRRTEDGGGGAQLVF